MSILAKHPLALFVTGVAVGFYAHKYRKELIESAEHMSELGKGFVMHQGDKDIQVDVPEEASASSKSSKRTSKPAN
jgi:hypothetical protein